jgi:hypothetical protein
VLCFELQFFMDVKSFLVLFLFLYLLFTMLRKLQINYNPNVMGCYVSYIQTFVLFCYYSVIVSKFTNITRKVLNANKNLRGRSCIG